MLAADVRVLRRDEPAQAVVFEFVRRVVRVFALDHAAASVADEVGPVVAAAVDPLDVARRIELVRPRAPVEGRLSNDAARGVAPDAVDLAALVDHLHEVALPVVAKAHDLPRGPADLVNDVVAAPRELERAAVGAADADRAAVGVVFRLLDAAVRELDRGELTSAVVGEIGPRAALVVEAENAPQLVEMEAPRRAVRLDELDEVAVGVVAEKGLRAVRHRRADALAPVIVVEAHHAPEIVDGLDQPREVVVAVAREVAERVHDLGQVAALVVRESRRRAAGIRHVRHAPSLVALVARHGAVRVLVAQQTARGVLRERGDAGPRRGLLHGAERACLVALHLERRDDLRDAVAELELRVEDALRLRAAVGERRGDVARERRIRRGAVIAPRLHAAPVRVVDEMHEEPRGVFHARQPVLLVGEPQRAPLAVANHHEVPPIIVFIGAVPSETARPAVHVEGRDVAVRRPPDMREAAGAVDEHLERVTSVNQGDPVAVAIRYRAELPAPGLALRGAEQVREAVGIEDDVRRLVAPERRALAEIERAADLRERARRARAVRTVDDDRAAPHLELPRERARPAVTEPHVAIDRRERIRAVNAQRERPGEDEIELGDGEDAASRDVHGVARRRAAAAAVRGVGAACAGACAAAVRAIAAAIGVLAAVLAVRALLSALPAPVARPRAAAVSAAAEDEDSGVHPGDGDHVGDGCRASHGRSLARRSSGRNRQSTWDVVSRDAC